MGTAEDNEILKIKRGLSWIEIKDSLGAEGCPICNIMIRSLQKYFDFLLSEYVLDVDVHKKVIASRGLCNTHTYLLMQAEKNLYSDGLGIATLFETTLQKEMKVLKRLNKTTSKQKKHLINFKPHHEIADYKKQTSEAMNSQGECIGCENQKHSESFYTHEILKLWDDSEFRKLYEKDSVLLCRLHFISLIEEADKSDIIDYFMEAQNLKLDKLYFQLSEFIRKHDYRFQKDMTNDDKKSWVKVLEYFGSKENIKREGYNNLFPQ